MTLGSSVTVRLALALAGFTAALPAQAQEELADLEGLLEEKVVTSASKTAETARAAPATSTTITAEQLRRYGIRTVDEAIRFLGVGATTNESQRQPDFGARGVLLHSDRNNHVLILVDGHRINEQVSAAGLIDRGLGVPIELIDHIEVILGPGSVLYGSSAMLGVINVVTKRAQEHEGLWVGAETEPLSLYRGNVGMGYVLGERAGLTLHLEAYRYQDSLDLPVVDDGLDGINGEPIIWGGEWENNEHQGFSAYSRLDLDALQMTLRTGLSERNNPHILFDNDNPDAGDQDRWLSLDARWSKVLSSEVELMARVYGDSTDTSLEQRASFPQFCLPGQLSGCDTSIEGKALSAGGELQTRFDWLADDSLKTLLGAQLLVRHVVFGVNIVDNETQANPGTAAFFDRVEQTLGVYAQHEVKLGADWVVNGGARFDTAPGFGSALSPRFAAAYSSWEGATFKVVYSRAFRGPNAAERGLEHPLLILKSQDLEAEKVTSVEGSYEQRLGSQRLLLNVFHTEWDNLLRLSRVSADVEAAAKADGRLVPFAPEAFQYSNDLLVESQGVVLGFDGTLAAGDLAYGASTTLARTRQIVGGGREEALPASPEVFGNANVSYRIGNGWPTVGAAGHFVGESPVFGIEEDTYPKQPKGPSRWVGRLTLTGELPGVAGLRYRAYVQGAVGDEAPVGLGPNDSFSTDNPNPGITPLETFKTGLGLDYNLPW